MRKVLVLLTVILQLSFSASAGNEGRKFIAHRGVNLRSTIAGENSLEAIRLAKKSGFAAIETDVRLTADDSLVVMHDVTINRTCLNRDGSKIQEPLNVADLTYAQLDNYRLKADALENREPVSLLSEYLAECKKNDILVFIEPKLVDPSGNYYRRIIAMADRILGKNNYVITSNNRANRIIRDSLKIMDVPMMGVLYQTTFEDVERLGNIIMAISATRIAEPDYTDYVNLSVHKNLQTESHADKFEYFNRINRNRINYVSTDFLAPDFKEEMTVIERDNRNITPESPIVLQKGEKVEIRMKNNIEFGAAYLNVNMRGDLKIKMGNQTFNAKEDGSFYHQILLYKTTPVLILTAIEPTVIYDLDFKTVAF